MVVGDRLLRLFSRLVGRLLIQSQTCGQIILGLAGVDCDELHGDKTQAQRLAALERFRASEVRVGAVLFYLPVLGACL